MKAAFSKRFIRQYSGLSPERKAKFDKQLAFLLANVGHPSLRAKKYDEAKDVCQARVDTDYRSYFQIEGDRRLRKWREVECRRVACASG